MRENALKALWANGKTTLNAWLSIPSSVTAEFMASAGWDSCTVDLQHGLIDYATALTMLQAISTTPVVPLVRVPWNEPGIIMKSLDAGAYGIICPMINSRREAEQFVGACRYAPSGYRSIGPLRAALYAGVDAETYTATANDQVLALAMIETAEALACVDEIVATPGLDGVYIGPSDLHLSMTGRFGINYTEGPVYDALLRIRDAARSAGIVACMHAVATPSYARKMIDLGYSLVTVANDALLLNGAARANQAELRNHANLRSSSAP